MELFLNSAWALLAFTIVYLWLRLGRRTVDERHLSFVALVMLLVILFPVISVSDDLWSIQNPAEADTCQRRDHRAGCPHLSIPAVANLPETAYFGLTFEAQSHDAPRQAPNFTIKSPALHSIQNRPPPAA
jgi:hypothetical protein